MNMRDLKVLTCHVERPVLNLTKAVLIYSGGHGQGYATVHEAISGPNLAQPSLSAGVPVTKSALVALMNDLGSAESYGFLPANVLAVGRNHLVWWSPPQKRTIWFKAQAPIGVRCGTTVHPGLVFAVIDGNWAIYAVKGTERPTADSHLFQAPYFNVWESGQICTGNVVLPDLSSVERMAAYESAFFGSYFTHPNIMKKGRLTRFRGGPFALWNSLLKRPRKVFPENSLAPLGRTAGDLVHAITTSGSFA